ncbi:MAG TPA: hypothetical protein VHS56_10050 [Candidatus Cybelea sp.]|nr:hypothetical protein [Candidatus Cybelea sp.]
MKALLPVLLAGGSFAGCAILGLGAGVLAAERFAQPVFAPGGLTIGGILGAYSAFRLLAKSMA